jgi:molecular chaperone HscB
VAVVDHFAVFGLPESYALDPDDLERRFHELSRKLHPDRFVKAAPRERVQALQAATALNDAYKVLKDPVKRAEHVIARRGHGIGEHDKVDAAFLMEMLELREENGHDKEAQKADMRARIEAAMAEIKDGAPDAQVKDALVRLRYFRRFLNELEGKEEL